MGELEVLEEKEKIILKGKDFSLEINRQSGLMEHVTQEGDTLIKSGPYHNLRVPGDAIQNSTLMMENLAVNWSCSETSFRMEKGIAVLETAGSYDHSTASFEVRIDASGILEISYVADSFLDNSSRKRNIQEAGIKFLCGPAFTELNWESEPYFTSYPESHPGRSKGTANLLYRPEMIYRSEPSHGWEKDSRGFYYFGLEERLPYTNEVRSLKANIYSYALYTENGKGLKVSSLGDQACRFDRIKGQNTLIINDQWDYNSLKWGNYYKAIPLPEKLEGKVILSLSPQ